MSFKGVEEETKDQREWKSWAQLIFVALECTVIRLHHSVPRSPGYDLENIHDNRLMISIVTECKSLLSLVSVSEGDLRKHL